MNDVNALMGKLRASVVYRNFADATPEDRIRWPVLERIARSKKEGDSSVGEAQSQSPVEAPSAPIAPQAGATAPAEAAKPANPRNAAKSPPREAEPVVTPPPASPPLARATAATPAPTADRSLLRRYSAAEPAAAPTPDGAQGKQSLSDVFARLERKTR